MIYNALNDVVYYFLQNKNIKFFYQKIIRVII